LGYLGCELWSRLVMKVELVTEEVPLVDNNPLSFQKAE
jgi:hypothetical protein